MQLDDILSKYSSFAEPIKRERKFNFKIFAESAVSIHYCDVTIENDRLNKKLLAVAHVARGESSQKNITDVIKKHATNIWTTIKKFFKLLWESITQFFRWFFDLTEKVKSAYNKLSTVLRRIDKKDDTWKSFLNTNFPKLINTRDKKIEHANNIKVLDNSLHQLLLSIETIGDSANLSKKIFTLGKAGQDGLERLFRQNVKSAQILKTLMDDTLPLSDKKDAVDLNGTEVYDMLLDIERALSMLVFVKSNTGSTLFSKIKDAQKIVNGRKGIDNILNIFDSAQTKDVSSTVKDSLLSTVKSTTRLLTNTIGYTNKYISYILKSMTILLKTLLKYTKEKVNKDTLAKTIKKEIIKRAFDPMA